MRSDFISIKTNTMDFPNIFTPDVAQQVVNRINKLDASTKPGWGKMDAAQMFAHCNVPYEMVYDNKHPKPNAFVRFLLNLFVKNTVVGKAPYKHSSQTAPAFLIKGSREFELEKRRLIDYINDTQRHGEKYFDGKESNSFGALNINEWNTMFYKHLDHHLTQFGV